MSVCLCEYSFDQVVLHCVEMKGILDLVNIYSEMRRKYFDIVPERLYNQ